MRPTRSYHEQNTWLVTPNASRKQKPGDRKIDIAKVDQIWIGIRGTRHNQRALKKFKTATFGKLIPQRNNPHDNTAISIETNGALIGYIPRAMANILYSQVGYLFKQNHALQIPLSITENSSEASAWACIPTTTGIGKLAPIDELAKAFRPLWENLPADLRDTISKDGFHLSSETGPELWKHTHHAPRFWFSKGFNEENIDHGVNLMLRTLRERRNQEVAQSRLQRNKLIVSANKNGLTNSQIADTYGVSRSLIYSALKAAGRTAVRATETGLTEPNKTSIIERAQKCLTAAELQSRGMSRGEIAGEMDISLKATEKYLTDGHFYNDMKRNLRRKYALQCLQNESDMKDFTDKEMRQSRIDALVVSHFNL